MIERIKAGLEYMADLYRTAPLGETLFLTNAGQITLNYDEPLMLGMSVLGSLAGIAITEKQFRLRKRLENSVSEHGYDDKVFDTTIPEWCDRQTARVVAKNHNCLDDYVALCDSNKDRMSLPNVKYI